MSDHCSEIVDCQILLKIKCVYCEVINYASQTDLSIDDDPSKFDIEEIKCWGCGKNSLVHESLLEMYPEYPNESVGGSVDGRSSLDYT